MYAIHLHDDNTLHWQPHQPASVQPGQVRIGIAATAVNRADLVQKQGLYNAPKGYSNIMGLECAGEIIEVGEQVNSLTVGTPVCALLTAGGYATEVVCDARQVLPIPAGISLHNAAAIPEVFATAWFNLFTLAGLQAGEKVLIKAGGSGVGTAAIQLCKAFNNSAYVQVGSDNKLQQCMDLGAQGGINRHQHSLRELAPAGPFDVVLDPIAGPSLNDTLKIMNNDARLLLIGLMGGAHVECDMGRLLVKRLKIQGSTLRSQAIEVKGQIMQALHRAIWPKIADTSIKPIIDTVIPITEVDQAHTLMASNQTFGKIVLTIDG